MPTFLTVKEASRLTGKSPSSIRRIIYPIIHDDAHADRGQVKPSVEDALKLRMKGDNFAWRLSEELLRREVPDDATGEKGNAPPTAKAATHGEAELIPLLRQELAIKNHQITQQSELITKQMELMNGLSERLREGNILIGSLQQRLALTDGRDTASPEPVKAKRPASSAAAKPTPAAAKPTTRPKKGFFARLFR
jgi:hypothetical protein